MAITIGVIKEGAADEKRVALVPAHVPGLTGAGEVSVVVETDAGLAAGYRDAAYREKGATIQNSRDEVLRQADILLGVRGGAANAETGLNDAQQLKEGALLVCLQDPWQSDPAFAAMAQRKHRVFSLELVPRITRAQSMDVLSSQANLAGYRSVLLAATHLPKIFPMLMTAAGTIVPARVLVVGVGVAGLQAIATAKRLGAIVSAYDIRPAVKEQVESLGARFVEMDLAAERAETTGGYAREMDEEFYRKQRELMTAVVAEQDVVITTAAIPGKPAPTLVTADMVEGMQPGSVIVDLAAERGGNCELTRPGESIREMDVLILGPRNVAAELPFHASQLYSKNLVTFLGTILKDGSITIDPADEIIAATLILDRGSCPDPAVAERLELPHVSGETATDAPKNKE